MEGGRWKKHTPSRARDEISKCVQENQDYCPYLRGRWGYTRTGRDTGVLSEGPTRKAMQIHHQISGSDFYFWRQIQSDVGDPTQQPHHSYMLSLINP